MDSISIHALLAESDAERYAAGLYVGYFYPRSPCGERHHSIRCAVHRQKISIHALLAESDLHKGGYYASCDISIHALLAESD